MKHLYKIKSSKDVKGNYLRQVIWADNKDCLINLEEIKVGELEHGEFCILLSSIIEIFPKVLTRLGIGQIYHGSLQQVI